MSADVKTGYKLTEVGVIPEDWEVKPLYTICTAILDCHHSTPVWTKSGALVIRNQNIRDGKLDFSVPSFTDEKHFLERTQRAIPTFGDLIITREAPMGLVCMIPEGLKCCLGQRMVLLRIDQHSTELRYVLYALLGESVQRFISIVGGTGSTVSNLRIPVLRGLQIVAPKKAEQEAIADALIESLEQLITKKRKIKQGAMQELLNPKEGWEKVKLGSLGVFLKGNGVKRDESMSGNIPCIRYGEIYTKHKDYIKAFDSWISPEVAATAKRIKSGDILFAGSGETKEEIGKCVAFLDDIEAYAGGDIVILRPNNANSLFLGCYLNTESVNRQKASRGQGDAVVHIGSNALADIDLIIPLVEEQAFIASVLFDMDAEIDALEAKLEKIRQLKQGMMYNLLTGKIRRV